MTDRVTGAGVGVWANEDHFLSGSCFADRLEESALASPHALDPHGILARSVSVVLCATGAHAGVNPMLEGRALQDALRRAIGTRRGYCWWDVDHAGWVVTLSSPEEQTFYGRTLEEALAWCLVWLMVAELGIRPFLV